LPPGNFTGNAIQIEASSNVDVTGNSATRAQETWRCIFVYATRLQSPIFRLWQFMLRGRFVQIEFFFHGGVDY